MCLLLGLGGWVLVCVLCPIRCRDLFVVSMLCRADLGCVSILVLCCMFRVWFMTIAMFSGGLRGLNLCCNFVFSGNTVGLAFSTSADFGCFLVTVVTIIDSGMFMSLVRTRPMGFVLAFRN